MTEKRSLEQYLNRISLLPVRDRYTKEDLFIPDFLIQKSGDLEIYYAPHNEYCNKKAKIFIIGIAPGFTQMEVAFRTARLGIESGLPLVDIQKNCKIEARFAGSMRKNLIEMLDYLGLPDMLSLESSGKLFQESCTLLHTTSVLCFPVFIDRKNYNGSKPPILKTKELRNLVEAYFLEEVNELENAFYIPLGNAVEEVLSDIIRRGLLQEEQCLLGFPHPSGVNGHRLKQLYVRKEKLKKKLESFFK